MVIAYLTVFNLNNGPLFFSPTTQHGFYRMQLRHKVSKDNQGYS